MAAVAVIKILSLLLGALLAYQATGEDLSTVAVNSERAQLLKDALGWMTFRKNGELLGEEELESLFLEPLLQKYATSKLYRSFVIAFQHGVLPRMTLTEDMPCDPFYTLEYKDPFNNSVTWHYQKNFTFSAYDDLGSRAFCDYRKGLICKSTTRTCECPADSKMQPIYPDSPVRRCQIQREKICALIDLAHESDPSQSPLASNLYHLIFNLEKPLSCSPGTQCRFKDENRNTPLCYGIDDGPWAQGKWVLGLGDECTLDLYADPGSCEVNDKKDLGQSPGFVCYNFGPPRSVQTVYPGVTSRTGFCYYEYGPYGVTNQPLVSERHFRPLIGSFVHPGTVPLRGEELRLFYGKYLSQVVPYFDDNSTSPFIEAAREGGRCSMAKTEAMEQAWNYFASLEGQPPRGQDYVNEATKELLNSNLEDIIKLAINPEQKVCKVYWDFEQIYPSSVPKLLPSLRCTEEDPTDSAGNDGTCQVHGVDTKPNAQKLLEFQRIAASMEEKLKDKAFSYRFDILIEHLDPPCLPSLGSRPTQNFSLKDPATLEGGRCPGDSVCYQDFSDTRGIYDSSCQLKVEDTQMLICHDPRRDLQACEDEHLSAKVEAGLRKLDIYAGLQLGDQCFYHFEMAVRDKDKSKLNKINKYQLLNWLERGLLCNMEEGLECALAGTCVCATGKNCKKRSRSFQASRNFIESPSTRWTAQVNKLVLIVTIKMIIFM